MVTVNKEDEILKKCSYVVISSYRRKVLETLKNDVKIPTKISEESGVVFFVFSALKNFIWAAGFFDF